MTSSSRAPHPGRLAARGEREPSASETGVGPSIERPQPSPANASRWGSDVIAELLRALDVEFVALTPGASFRGLHDSLVNHLGNTRPEMLLVLHELIYAATMSLKPRGRRWMLAILAVLVATAAIAAGTTDSSITSATSARACCSTCTMSMRYRSRTAMRA